jgi:hypothetical protein
MLIVKLKRKTAAAIGKELHAYEIGLQLKDIGTDGTDNYGIYDEKNVVPAGAIEILPDASVPPAGSQLIEKGKLNIGGVEQVFAAYRLP